jgi:succinoglycan biosynthesis protein ExoA
VPGVSVLLPTLNERTFIRDCLDSLLAQDYPNLIEILVLDGGSTDGTVDVAAADVAAAEGRVVRVIPNGGITAAAAMNLGIATARGEIVVRADAHTLYAPDYVSRCVDALEAGPAVVGGLMRAVGTTNFGRAVAAVTSSPAGVGPGRFHYARDAADVETVYLGAWRRETVEAVGGFDERLQWGAEDQELNYRLRRAGGRIRLDPSIRSWYFPRSTPRALWRQYYNYGLCKASTLKKHRTLPYWRPLAPASMVVVVTGATAWSVWSRRRAPALVPAVYLLGLVAVASRVATDPGVAPHRALAALGICHWAYGLGLWSGVGRIVTGRPFDHRPRQHR